MARKEINAAVKAKSDIKLFVLGDKGRAQVRLCGCLCACWACDCFFLCLCGFCAVSVRKQLTWDGRSIRE